VTRRALPGERPITRAFLLAAGRGTRLRPITDHTPKCLVPVCGKPLLQIWLELFERFGIEEVLVNTHHLAATVDEFARNWNRAPRLRLSHETTLLGSAGTLRENWKFVGQDESFLVCYADNLTDVDLGRLMAFHRRHSSLVTMTLFQTDRPRECGIAQVRDDGLILSFEEKPASPKSALANAGIYIMRAGVRRHLPEKAPADIAIDMLPNCLGEMRGWTWKGFLADIGSPDAYARAQELWAQRQAAHGPPGH